MAFWMDPIIEEQPKCIVCDTVMYDRRWEDGLICSATCSDIWVGDLRLGDHDMDSQDDLYA